MIAEKVVEVASRRPARIDVSVRIDERDPANFRVQVLGQKIVQHGAKNTEKNLGIRKKSPLFSFLFKYLVIVL
jgi:hypothetical protein